MHQVGDQPRLRKASLLPIMQHSICAAVRSSPFDLTIWKRDGRSVELISILNTSFECRFTRHLLQFWLCKYACAFMFVAPFCHYTAVKRVIISWQFLVKFWLPSHLLYQSASKVYFLYQNTNTFGEVMPKCRQCLLFLVPNFRLNFDYLRTYCTRVPLKFISCTKIQTRSER